MFTSGKVLPTKIQPPLLRPMAYRVLSKKYGLSIKSDGLAALSDFIGSTFGMDWKRNPDTIKFLEVFATVWKQQERGLFVDSTGVKDVINELKEREKATLQESQNMASIPPKTKTYNNGGGKTTTIDRFLTKRPSPSDNDEGPLDQSIDDIPVSQATQIDEEELPMAQEISDQISSPARDQTPEEEFDNRILNWRDYFRIINTTDQKKFSYNPVKRQIFYQPPKDQLKSVLKIPNVQAKTDLFRTRYFLTRDRLLRNESFQSSHDTFNPLSSMIQLKNNINNNNQDDTPTGLSITQIKNLLGRDGQNFLILGVLKMNPKGQWSLEDASGSIDIDISQTLPSPGLFYIPGAIVLAEGIYYTVGHTFAVTSMTFPPGERRDKTLDHIGNLDLLGIHGTEKSSYIPRLDNEIKIRLHLLEQDLTHQKFVLLGGDLFLDDQHVMDGLKKVFTKLDQEAPTVIVLFGSFSSFPVHAAMSSKNISSTTEYKNNFDSLAEMLSQFENIINHTHVVLIPGPHDPWVSLCSLGANGSLPQSSIPTHFSKRMNKICKNITWASNPTRIAYLSQEIVLFRDNFLELCKRHQILFPVVESKRAEDLAELEEQMANNSIDDTTILVDRIISEKQQLPAKVLESRKVVKTLLDQGHLSPFVDSIRPISWDMDHTLTVYPIPSTLILADMSSAAYDLTYNGCKTINPGKFIHKRQARYIQFQPYLKSVSQEEVFF